MCLVGLKENGCTAECVEVGCDELEVVLFDHGVIDLPTSGPLELHGVTDLNECVSAIVRKEFGDEGLPTEVVKGDFVVLVVIEVGDDVVSAA